MTRRWLSSCLCLSSWSFSISATLLSCSFFLLLEGWVGGREGGGRGGEGRGGGGGGGEGGGGGREEEGGGEGGRGRKRSEGEEGGER